MPSNGGFVHPETDVIVKQTKTKRILTIIGATAIIICLTILGISIATLVKVNHGFKSEATSVTTAATTLVSSIQVKDVLDHLNELQQIATSSNGNRAVSTIGFNRTLDYITRQLRTNTNLDVSNNRFFYIRQFELASDPVLIANINGQIRNYSYSTDLSKADFYFIEFSGNANFGTFQAITVIPNLGCDDNDWRNANPPAAGRIVLVKRGICAFATKGELAAKYNAMGLLIYNDGATPDRVSPIAIGLGQENQLPALFLSYPVGQALADAVRNVSVNVGIRMIINTKDLPLSPVGNICADTPTGDPTQTIIIGSHSDSVPAGPGINDNGSGSAANLALAIALSRLLQTSTYRKYNYRVRFCWWGAEEIGLLGSEFHVDEAKKATSVGERLQDYLINLNYDMLGSPNFIFGIYDGKSASNDTPTQALSGSIKMTNVYKEWFDQQKLPWSYSDFDGRSDYGPFLAEGIAASGLFSGADDVKSQEERDYYDRMLGTGLGGIAGIIEDPCYHQACDSIQNINVFALEKMVQAAAYALEYLGHQENLSSWLYPNGRTVPLPSTSQRVRRKHHSKHGYLGLPSI